MKYLVNTVKMIAEQYPNLNLEIEKDTVRLKFDTKDTCENKILEITQIYSKLKVTILPEGIKQLTDLRGLKHIIDTIENVSSSKQDIEMKKLEAKKRLQLLNVHQNVINEFMQEDKLNKSDGKLGILYWLDDNEEKMIKDFQENYGVLVYHVIKTYTIDMGIIYDLLYISEDIDCWDIEKDDLKNGYALSYTISTFSESGVIKIKPVNGGVIREY